MALPDTAEATTAVHDELTGRNHEAGVEERRVRPLTDTEAQRVLAAAASRLARQRLMLRLLLEHRLTAHEICRLDRADLRGSVITVRDKRGASRTLMLEGPAAEELAEVTVGGGDGQLFGGRSGPMRPDAVRRLLLDAAADAGLTGAVSIHRARRFADTTA